MATTNTIPKKFRQVTTKNVYKKLFDAEVDLVKSLSKERTSFPIQEKPNSIPLVRESRGVLGNGILTDRQKRWLFSNLNDERVENPVYLKKQLEAERKLSEESESYKAAKDVTRLQDKPAKTGIQTNTIEKINRNRYVKHENLLDDFYQELGMVSRNYENQILEACSILKERLAESDKELELLMNRLADDEILVKYSMCDLNEIWNQVASISEPRRKLMHDLDEELDSIEVERSKQLIKILHTYGKQLVKTAHILTADVERLLDDEAQHINMSLLANKKSFAELFARLLTADVQREYKQRLRWQERVQDWRRLKKDAIIQSFETYMKDLALNNPANIREEINKLKEQQRTINTKRLHLLDTLRDVKPPASTKNAVAQWKSAMITVTKRIASLHNKYLRRLYEEYDHAYDACLNEMSEHQELLATEGICKKEEIYIIIKNNFLPLLDERQQRYRQEMRAIENHFHDLLPTQEEQIMKVFQFVQGIAHIWDGHETALINRETALKSELERGRLAHDASNQEKEASLDILLDRMRQDYSEESLQRNLNKCYEFLEEVRQGYIEFQQEQKSIVKNYTQIIENELKKYEDNVLKYFGLIRHEPDIQQFGDDEDAITIKKRRRRPSKRGREEKILPDSVIEALSLSNGKTFYIVTSPHQHGFNPESSVFSLQPPADVDANQNEIRDYSENIAIKNSFILSLKTFVRKTFLEHMMAWREQAMERANNVVTSKVKELDSELELRLHLHGPRTSRIEYDVHNVRASELLLHRERLREHVTAVTRSLTKERAKVTDLSATHQVDVDQFLHVIEAFEPKLTSARKTAHLVAIEVDVQDQLDSFIHGIRSSIREFRRLLDDRLTELRDSNAKFLKSFKLFSEGGNFCPDEVNEFRKKLEKLSRKIDKEEGLILADLEGMETKRLENANEIASKFLDKSKHHLYDLTYIEKVARLITNTEVKIKAEVADSNSQSQKLVKYLDQLEKRIDAVNHPNMDKEQISSIEVYNSLVEIFHSFKDRVDYLSCQKEVEPVSESPANQSSLGAPPTASSVDSSGEPSISTSITSLKAAKKLSRHTKQRLKAKKRFKVPPNTTETDEREESSAASPPTPLETLKVDRGISEKKRSKSMGKSKKKRHREGTGDKLVKAHSFSKMGSADIDRARSANESLNSRSSIRSAQFVFGTKIDKKYLIFGEKNDGDEQRPSRKGFMVVIKNILRESLDSLLTTSDLYYRQKSQKNITRPEQVAESFEACAESLTQRLQSYHNQSDEYHKSCIKELHTQIISFLNCLQYVPEPVIKEILQRYRNDAQLSRANVREELHAKLQPLQAEKGDNESLLRPSLGHPQNIQELNELLTKEKRRQTEVIDLIKSIASTQKESEVYYASMFLEELSKFSSRTLLYFDEAYIPDDIITMDSGEVKKYNAIELMRHRLRAKPKTADEKSDKSNDEIDVGLLIATTWLGLPSNELTLAEESDTQHFPSTFTRKTSKAHKAVVVARDQAYKEYHQYFKKSIELIEKELETSLIKEERWAVCWEKSIKKMQDLYADYK